MENSKKRVGIMGGTFDPIHMGHVILAEKAYEQLSLDQVLFMPSGNPPHKTERSGRATDEQRVEMVRCAIHGNTHFTLSLMEMNQEGYSYTYLTLEQLHADHPDTDYFFIIGADSLFNFDTWMHPERICAACTLVVATRNHTPKMKLQECMERLSSKYGGHFMLLDMLNVDISSHDIRTWIYHGNSIRYYVCDEVRHYIESRDIYPRMRQKS